MIDAEETDAARRPRGFHLRTLMLAILVAAIVFGLIAQRNAQVRWRQTLRDTMTLQRDLTNLAQFQFMHEIANRFRGTKGTQGGGSTSSDSWSQELIITIDSPEGCRTVVGFKIAGGIQADRIEPIRVESTHDDTDVAAIEGLARTYREHGWAYQILTVPSDPPSSH